MNSTPPTASRGGAPAPARSAAAAVAATSAPAPATASSSAPAKSATAPKPQQSQAEAQKAFTTSLVHSLVRVAQHANNSTLATAAARMQSATAADAAAAAAAAAAGPPSNPAANGHTRTVAGGSGQRAEEGSSHATAPSARALLGSSPTSATTARSAQNASPSAAAVPLPRTTPPLHAACSDEGSAGASVPPHSAAARLFGAGDGADERASPPRLSAHLSPARADSGRAGSDLSGASAPANGSVAREGEGGAAGGGGVLAGGPARGTGERHVSDLDVSLAGAVGVTGVAAAAAAAHAFMNSGGDAASAPAAGGSQLLLTPGGGSALPVSAVPGGSGSDGSSGSGFWPALKRASLNVAVFLAFALIVYVCVKHISHERRLHDVEARDAPTLDETAVKTIVVSTTQRAVAEAVTEAQERWRATAAAAQDAAAAANARALTELGARIDRFADVTTAVQQAQQAQHAATIALLQDMERRVAAAVDATSAVRADLARVDASECADIPAPVRNHAVDASDAANEHNGLSAESVTADSKTQSAVDERNASRVGSPISAAAVDCDNAEAGAGDSGIAAEPQTARARTPAPLATLPPVAALRKRRAVASSAASTKSSSSAVSKSLSKRSSKRAGAGADDRHELDTPCAAPNEGVESVEVGAHGESEAKVVA